MKMGIKDTITNTEGEARQWVLLINKNKTNFMIVTRTAINGQHLQCGKCNFEHVKELSYQCTQLNQTPPTAKYMPGFLMEIGSITHMEN
jgi:hypothetical protein